MSLRSWLHATTSAVANSVGLPGYEPAQPKITHRIGKPGTFGRRIIDYKRSGPFYEQVGEKRVGFVMFPIMRTSYIHRFLHATKGWRVYVSRSPNLCMPLPNRPRRQFVPAR